MKHLLIYLLSGLALFLSACATKPDYLRPPAAPAAKAPVIHRQVMVETSRGSMIGDLICRYDARGRTEVLFLKGPGAPLFRAYGTQDNMRLESAGGRSWQGNATNAPKVIYAIANVGNALAAWKANPKAESDYWEITDPERPIITFPKSGDRFTFSPAATE